jgi:hypothetical protein
MREAKHIPLEAFSGGRKPEIIRVVKKEKFIGWSAATQVITFSCGCKYIIQVFIEGRTEVNWVRCERHKNMDPDQIYVVNDVDEYEVHEEQ